MRRSPTSRWLLAFLALLLAPGLLAPPALALGEGQAAALVLGQPSFGSDGLATASRLFRSHDIALDPTSGALFVADTYNHRVLRFASQAALANNAPADGVLGQPDFTSHTPAVAASGMDKPSGVAVDGSGRLWVADNSNHRVLRFDRAAGKPDGAPADGVLGQADFTSNSGAAGPQGMNHPSGVAVDGSGRLWVADTSNSRVLRFDAAAGKPDGAAANSVLGQSSFAGAIGAASAGRMAYPSHAVVDEGGRLWVTDSGNSRVLRFDAAAGKPDGAAADGVLGQPNFTGAGSAAGPQGMSHPSSLVVDGSGRLWVADTSNNRVLRFDAAAGKPDGAAADGVLGQPDFAGTASATTAQAMYLPSGLALDAGGRLWVADTSNNRVLRFEAAAGKPDGAAADGVLGQSTFITSRQVTADSMYLSDGVAVDPATGKVFVADMGNSRVLRFASRASLTSGASAEGVLGQPDFTSSASAASAQGMDHPTGMAMDANGRLWVADTGNNRVLRFEAAASKPDGAAADGVLGQPDFASRSSATSPQRMHAPLGLALDRSGRLWIADMLNHRVLRFDAAAGKPDGAAADGVLGQPDFTSSASATSAAGMKGPYGVALDESGRLWVADSGNSRVLRFDAAAARPNGASADSLLGQPDAISSKGVTSAEGMREPRGVAVDGSGRLWVADSGNHRVLRFDAAAARPAGSAADAVLGQPDLSSASRATTAQGMQNPEAVAVDASGWIWVADASNSRVLLFEPPGPGWRVFLPAVSR